MNGKFLSFPALAVFCLAVAAFALTSNGFEPSANSSIISLPEPQTDGGIPVDQAYWGL
jgi:hypothetical protein